MARGQATSQEEGGCSSSARGDNSTHVMKQLHSHITSCQIWLVVVYLLVAPPPVNIRRKHLSSYSNSLYAVLVPLFCKQISSRYNQLLISLKTYTYCLTYCLTGLIVVSVLGTLSPSIMQRQHTSSSGNSLYPALAPFFCR